MCSAEVTAISLVTSKTRSSVCAALVPTMTKALSRQRVTFKRQPISEDYIDWIIDDTDLLSVALDETDGQCCILLATQGDDDAVAARRVANIAAEICREFDVHTLFWNGARYPISAADFLGPKGPNMAKDGARVVPRRPCLTASRRRAQHAREAKLDHWILSQTRAHMNGITTEELESFELDERRAKTAPLRLSAWMMSLATALIAAPLAIPLFVHNLVRGEDVRSGSMALGVACLYSALATSGVAPGLTTSLF